MVSAFVMWVALAGSPAQAAEPTFEVLPDGTIEARMHFDATVDELRAVISNPKVRQDLSSDVYSVDVKPEGRCSKLQISTRGMFRPLAVLSVFCPTDSGFKESLVSSSDFTHYEQEWSFTPRANGTDVVFRTHSVPNLPVPTAVLNNSTQSSVSDMFGKLVVRLVTP